ncbi:MAG: hypothetical protein QNJ34_17435 [Xenococcaceae cyanobacterium MO_188.B29]|nr:hypothetical protein [Xenococcaceae cyanobacterium MO_188.B29]
MNHANYSSADFTRLCQGEDVDMLLKVVYFGELLWLNLIEIRYSRIY